MHISTHGYIERDKPIGELIEEGVNLSIDLQRNYTTSGPEPPEFGQFAWRADLDIWTHFSLEDIAALNGLGSLLESATTRIEGSVRNHSPGIFAVRVKDGVGRSMVDPVHLMKVETIDQKKVAVGEAGDRTKAPDSVFEVGVGRIIVARNRDVLASASVVLRKLVSSDEEHLSARAYAKSGKYSPEELVDESDLPDQETCKDFLQMHRNAMWNSVSEPI